MDFKKIPEGDLLKYVRDKIGEFESSGQYLLKKEGVGYYNGELAIDTKQRVTIGKDGKRKVITNLPNTKWKDNQYSKLVDQKVNYMLSEKPNVECEDDTLREELESFMDMRFMRTLSYVAQDVFNTAEGWLYVTTDGNKIKTKIMDPLEIIPIWEDNSRESLSGLIRKRTGQEWDLEKKKTASVDYIELYTREGVIIWRKEGNQFALYQDLSPYIKKGDTGYTWNKIPFVYFRYNRSGQTLLQRVKSLQDGINTILSNFGDNMLEDPRNTIIVLKGYDGEDLGDFREKLALYSTVKLTEDEFGKADVNTLEIKVNKDNYESVLRILKEKLIENGRGVDAKTGILGSNPNQMNIMSMYTDIELDCNNIEREFQASFEYLQGFIKQVKNIRTDEVAQIFFKRNLLVNQAERVDMLVKSRGLVSDETLLVNHPLVNNAMEEIEKRDKELEEKFMPSLQGNPFVGDVDAQEE